MNFNEEQRNAIYGGEPLIVVSAGAGSGKTRVLTERYVHLCELKLHNLIGKASSAMGAEANEIVTLTFTEDAALEMRGRIRKRLLEKWQKAKGAEPELAEEASAYWKKQIENLETAIISTFHSFCQRLVQENSFEAGLYPDLQVMDDVQSTLLKSQIFSEMVEEAEQSQKWHTLRRSMSEGRIKSSLFEVYGQMREYESSGSWQDRLRVQSLIEDWNSSMTDYENRFYRFFQSTPDVSGLTKARKPIFDHLKGIFQKGLHGEELFLAIHTFMQSTSMKNKAPDTIESQSKELYDVLQGWFSVRNIWFCQNQNLARILLDFEDMLITFDERYEQKKREAAMLDFSDLQQKAIRLMNDPVLQDYYRSMFKHFLVDEMQDTNQLQLRMIEKMNPRFRFIVGDGKQSIYRFRGADVQIFNELIHEAKEDGRFSFIDLNTNYRTCDYIIRFINLLFADQNLMGVEPGAAVPAYKTEYSPMAAFRDSKREREKRVELIKVTKEQNQSQDENQYVMMARRMIELFQEKHEIFDKDLKCWRRVEWSDMAVLMAARTNLTTLELALKSYDIPYNVYGGLGFYERQEVVDYLTLLQWLNKPYEMLYLLAVLRGPLFGVTVEELLEIDAAKGDELTFAGYIYEKRFEELDRPELRLKLAKFCRLFEKWVPFPWRADNCAQFLGILEDSGLKKVLLLQKNNLMKLKNVEKFIDTMLQVKAVSMDDLLEKIAMLADLAEKEGDAEVELSGGNFVHIMTVHGSKGLEFPVVFVPNLSKGMRNETAAFRFDVEEGLAVKLKVEDDEDLLAKEIEFSSPNFHSIHDLSRKQAIEESKRLLYVALTRARDVLVLSSLEKGESNTWHCWLETAMENNHELVDLIEIKEGIPEQKAIGDTKEISEGPTVKLDREVPISFSVSEVMSYVNDPDGFLEKHILKLDELWLETVLDEDDLAETDSEVEVDEKLAAEVDVQVDPRVLGTLVHRICELLDQGYSESDAYQDAFSIIEGKETYLEQVRPLIQAYLERDFGKPLENEWEFVLNVDGVEIIGEIDKVVLKDGRIEILDLKTNRIRDNVDELVQYYQPQLYLYKMAYEQEKGVNVYKMSLMFLRDKGQVVYEVKFDALYERRILEAISEMATLKRG